MEQEQKRKPSSGKRALEIEKRESVMAEIAYNLKRSSSNSSNQEKNDLKQVPKEFFKSDFRLANSFFTIKDQQEAKERDAELTQQLAIVEANLGREITNNFDKFSIAFDNFDEIKDDLVAVQK